MQQKEQMNKPPPGMSVNPPGSCITPAGELLSTVPFALETLWAFIDQQVVPDSEGALLWVCMATEDEEGEEEADDCVVVLLVLVPPGKVAAVNVGFIISCNNKVRNKMIWRSTNLEGQSIYFFFVTIQHRYAQIGMYLFIRLIHAKGCILLHYTWSII